jgi:hypothetical protein
VNPLFPQLPEDLASLSDTELAEVLAAHLSAVQRIKNNDQDFIGDRSAAQVVDELQAGVEQIKALREEQAERADAAEEYERTVSELAAEADLSTEEAPAEDADAGEDDDAAEEDDDSDEAPAEGEAAVAEEAAAAESTPEAEAEEVEAEPVTASNNPHGRARMRLRRPPAPSLDRTPVAEEAGFQLRASAGIEGVRAGAVLDRRSLALALQEASRQTTVLQPGVQQNVVVASATYEFPEERVLDDRDAESNGEKFRALLDKSPEEMQSLIASGGFCAPFTPMYDSVVYAVADRPVRDGLPSFQPRRGGITYPPALSLADARDAITIWDNDTDTTPGTATKACLVIDCDAFLSAEIEAIVACVQHGNFAQMTWPERISELADLVAAAHAEAGEVELLDGLKAGSTQVTDAGVYGAVSSLLSAVLQGAAGIRNRERMNPDTQMRAILPAWTADLLVMDLVNSQFNRFERNKAGVRALLGTFGINVSWYMDSETGGGQMFASQGAGALQQFPDTVKWFLFPEGTWIFLDRGRLDLGIVRDSTLNATNDFQVFYETFEGIAKIGPTSLEITSTICPSGETGLLNTQSGAYTC